MPMPNVTLTITYAHVVCLSATTKSTAIVAEDYDVFQLLLQHSHIKDQRLHGNIDADSLYHYIEEEFGSLSENVTFLACIHFM